MTSQTILDMACKWHSKHIPMTVIKRQLGVGEEALQAELNRRRDMAREWHASLVPLEDIMRMLDATEEEVLAMIESASA